MTDAPVDAILDTIAAAAPTLRENFLGRRGGEAGENPTGDTRVAADVMADELFVDRLGEIDGVGALASEEREGVIDCGDGVSVALDPLDGSSNLASNNAAGAIVGVYDDTFPTTGRSLIAAASLVFGPVTTLTAAVDGTVTEYEVIDGERQAVEEDVTLPAEPTIYGFGGGDSAWHPPFAAFADEIRHELKLRYGGAFVADVNQILEYGGLFAYPSLNGYPQGKLRYQFEAAPMGYLLEAAGGAASDGNGSLLDRTPDELHARCPVYLGNETLVDRLESALE